MSEINGITKTQINLPYKNRRFVSPVHSYDQRYKAFIDKFGRKEALFGSLLGALKNDAFYGVMIDGRKWVNFTLRQLCERTGLSQSTIQRYSKYLEDLGIILIYQNPTGADRSLLYSIDLNKLQICMGFPLEHIFGACNLEYINSMIQPNEKVSVSAVDNSIPCGQNDHHHVVKMNKSYIESKNLTKNLVLNTVEINNSVDNSHEEVANESIIESDLLIDDDKTQEYIAIRDSWFPLPLHAKQYLASRGISTHQKHCERGGDDLYNPDRIAA